MSKKVRYQFTLERGQVVRILILLLDHALGVEAAMKKEGALSIDIDVAVRESEPLFELLAQAIEWGIPFGGSLDIRRAASERWSPGPGNGTHTPAI